MKWWLSVSPVLRRLVAVAMLALLADATGVRAAVECTAVDQNGLPRDCTLSERLGDCGMDVLDSFEQCLDEDNDGFTDDASWWWEQYCGFWAAADLLACGLIVPWEAITGLG